MPRKELSLEDRSRILQLHTTGQKSYAEIATIMSRSKSTIQTVIGRFKYEGRIENKCRSGRPSALSDRDKRQIKHLVDRDPFSSAVQIASEISRNLQKDVHPETVRRAIKSYDLKSYTPRKKPYVNLVNRKKRLEFAKAYVDRPIDFWRKVIFSDESKYNIFGSDGRLRVWRRPGEALNPKNTKKTVKHGGGGLMVWGCIAASGVGNLEFVDGVMDQYKYIDILKRNLQSSAEKLGIRSDYYFQQDNDPKHKAMNTRLYLAYNTPHLLETPPQSPDINPIEHVWNMLERKIRNHHITNKNLLRKALHDEWIGLSTDFIEKLVLSMPNRLREVIKLKGYPTRY